MASGRGIRLSESTAHRSDLELSTLLAGSNISDVLFPSAEIDTLRSGLAETAFQLAVDTTVDPLALSRAGAPLFRRTQVVVTPDGSAAVGLGSAWTAAGSGPGRFSDLAAKLGAATPGEAPIFTGFSFHHDGPSSEEWAGFAPAEAVVPEIAVVSDGATGRLIVTGSSRRHLDKLVELLAGLDTPPPAGTFEPGYHAVVSHPPPSDWKIEVEEALGVIGEDELAKVVLSRSVVVRTERPPDGFELLEQLRDSYPQCYVFAWQSDDGVFIGASPELLMRKQGSALRLNPLAGSARRGEGEVDDRYLGEALLASAKDRREHQLVVDDIATRLAPLVTDLDIPTRPALRRMATVQHLSTEIVGRVRPEVGPLQLVEAMHPTPAVGGTPRRAALAFVEKVEGIDRGWYTGGIGWVTAAGDAVFAIPLRCALIRGTRSHLYAGAGIVKDSTPDGELDETRLKFRPMLSLLTAT